MKKHKQENFAEQSSQKQKSAASEFIGFLLHNKKWWITPICILLLLISGLILLGGTGVAPFIYSLF